MSKYRHNNYYPGKGYRLLREGEFMRRSDEFWDGYEWRENGLLGKKRRGEAQVRRKTDG